MEFVRIGIIGLGYAGFPMTLLFSKVYDVVGFDLSESRVAELNACHDRGGDTDRVQIREMLESGRVLLTTDLEQLRSCNFYVVVVPTPVDSDNKPDLSYIINASRKVGSVLSAGDTVVFESTVYPGATEQVCVPEIEAASGLKLNRDFFVGYSPERINPGDRLHTANNIIKVTSGSTPEAARFIDSVYASVLGEGFTWQASSISVAEACKVVENAQRDVNIAFVNEVAKILHALNIDVNEVIDAMNTKWNALGFRPGLVGGHCIGIDPYYLIACAANHGVEAGLMSAARRVNSSMPQFAVDNVMAQMQAQGKTLDKASVLLLGFTFKENCPDVRNTRVADIYRIISAHTGDITVLDPRANRELCRTAYGIEVLNDEKEIEGRKYDAVVLCVAHDEFLDFDFEKYMADGGTFYDVKGAAKRNRREN